MVNLAYHWLSILLLRPLFRPGVITASSSTTALSGPSNSPETEGHAKRTLQTLREAAAAQCPASANQIVRLFDRYDALYGLRFSPITAPQIAYMAGQIHLGMYFAATTPSAREKSRSMVNSCIGILEKIGVTWVSGNVTASILKRLLENGERRMILSSATLGLPSRSRQSGTRVRSAESSSESFSPARQSQISSDYSVRLVSLQFVSSFYH